MQPDLETIETPAAIVELDRMEANLARVADYCRTHGLAWRPHVKTHKSPRLAAAQIRAGAVGVTVATPREAEVMTEAVEDMLLAYPPVGATKLARLMALPPGVRLTVGLDSRAALEGLAAAAREAGRTVGVLVEIDVGMGRVGVQTPDDAVALAREAVQAAAVEYRGVMFYPGHIRSHVDAQGNDIRAVNERLGAVLEALRSAELAPEVVSGGSTPTLWRSHEFEGVTEVRPGTNIFNDRTTAEVGACEADECAYTVLATVVSTAVPGQAVVDAGSKALAKEELRAEGGGYGVVAGRPEVAVKAVSEEHGILDLSGTDWRPGVGSRVQLVPNHVCVSVNLQEWVHGVRDGRLVESWEVVGRGRSSPAAA